MFIPIEILLMLISGGLLFGFAPPLVSLFTDSREVGTLAVTVLRMVAVSEPLYGFSIIIEGMMQGTGKTRLPRSVFKGTPSRSKSAIVSSAEKAEKAV